MIEKTEEHESYGIVGFTRATIGSGLSGKSKIRLFGSNIEHSEFISLKISRASLNRSLHKDWYSAIGVPYIEVIMSQTQFAEAITSMNIGDGVPCTINYLKARKIEPPPSKSKMVEYQDEFEEHMEDVVHRTKNLRNDVEELLSSKVSGKLRKLILNKMDMIIQDIEKNIPFINTSFSEQMDRVILEAKGEIEAFYHNKITRLGMKALKDMPQIEGDCEE